MSALLLNSKLPIACVVHDQFISFQRFVDIVLTNLHHIPGSGILASTIWKLRIHVHVIMCKEVDRRQMLSICADNRCYVAPCCGGVTRHSPRMSLNSEYYFVLWHTNATFSTHNSSAPIPDIRSPPDAETELYWPRLGSKCGPEEALAGFAWYRAWYIRHLTVPNRRIWVAIDMLETPGSELGYRTYYQSLFGGVLTKLISYGDPTQRTWHTGLSVQLAGTLQLSACCLYCLAWKGAGTTHRTSDLMEKVDIELH